MKCGSATEVGEEGLQLFLVVQDQDNQDEQQETVNVRFEQGLLSHEAIVDQDYVLDDHNTNQNWQLVLDGVVEEPKLLVWEDNGVE